MYCFNLKGQCTERLSQCDLTCSNVRSLYSTRQDIKKEREKERKKDTVHIMTSLFLDGRHSLAFYNCFDIKHSL